jgi:hypothetical protein
VTIAVTAIEPTVLILTDGSGSMVSNIADGAGTIMRWEAVDQTWMDATTGSLKPIESLARFAFASFNANSPCPTVTETSYAINNHNEISTLFDSLSPEGMATLGDALVSLTPALISADGTAKRVVLTIDGEPGRCENPTPDPGGLDEAVAAVEGLFALGILTRVIGLGDTDVSASTIAQLANAGVGLDPATDPPAPHAIVVSLAEYKTAVNEALGECGLATFAFDGVTVDLARAGELTVSLGGNAIAHDPVDGFSVSDDACAGAAQCIRLNGAARDLRFSNSSAALEVSGPESILL